MEYKGALRVGGVFDLVMGPQDQELRQGPTACTCSYVVFAHSELSMESVLFLVQLCRGAIYEGVQLFLWVKKLRDRSREIVYVFLVCTGDRSRSSWVLTQSQ